MNSQRRGALATARADLEATRLVPSTPLPDGREYALAPQLAALGPAFDQGRLGVLLNVGPLSQPTSKRDDLAGAPVPPKLFSHNDQESVWQASTPEGATSGWGGRVGDMLQALLAMIKPVGPLNNLLEQDHARIVKRAIEAGDDLSRALAGLAPARTVFPATPLAGQLKMVRDMIAQRGALGVQSQVTTFTASDFGRTLASNGDGSDHGWGSHHVVMGGAVDGKKFFGHVPNIEADSEDDIGQGRLLPTMAVDQLAATLAGWMGVSGTSDLRTVVPNIGAYEQPDLKLFRA